MAKKQGFRRERSVGFESSRSRGRKGETIGLVLPRSTALKLKVHAQQGGQSLSAAAMDLIRDDLGLSPQAPTQIDTPVPTPVPKPIVLPDGPHILLPISLGRELRLLELEAKETKLSVEELIRRILKDSLRGVKADGEEKSH